MADQPTIQGKLAEWRQYCSDWANAYHRAAQGALAWNSRLVVIAICAAAVITGISGFATQQELAFLGYIAAGVGVVTATVNGLQKATFASPDQAKEYHSSAVAYGQVARHIDSVLITDSGITVEDLKKKLDEIETQLNAVDSQAPELPSSFKKLASPSKEVGPS